MHTFEIVNDEDDIHDNIYYVLQQHGEEAAKKRIRQRVNTSLNYDIEFNFDTSGKSMSSLFMPNFKVIIDEADSESLDASIRKTFDVEDMEVESGKSCYLCYHGEGHYAFTLQQVSSIISEYKNEIDDKLLELRIPRAKVIFCVDELLG